MKKGTIIGLVAVLIPTIFLVRNAARLVRVENDHARAQAAFEAQLQASKARQASAEAPGKDMDTAACVEWATARCPDPGGTSCYHCMDFLRGCLASCTRSEDYCRTVPGYTAATSESSDAWRKQQRERYRFQHWDCAAMFKFVQLHCHPLAVEGGPKN